MILYFDTGKPETTIKLLDTSGNIVDQKVWLSDRNQTEELLSEINVMLSKNRISKKDLKKIIVYTGQGSYTGLRVGVSTANALAFSLNIPVLGVTNEGGVKQVLKTRTERTFTNPAKVAYAHPPKITKAKSK